MKKSFVLLIFFSVSVCLKPDHRILHIVDSASQVRNQRTDSVQSKPKREYKVGYAWSVGPENIGVLLLLPPKMSIYAFDRYPKVSTYFGADAAMTYLAGFSFSGSVFYGLKYKIFTFDSSLSLLHIPEQKSNPFNEPIYRFTGFKLNPKFGLNFRFIWFKWGPSIPLSKGHGEFYFYDFLSYNYELALLLPLRIK